jgi:hypothetical protein
MVNRDVAWAIIFGTGRSTQSERHALSAGAVAMRIIAGRVVRPDIIGKDGAFHRRATGTAQCPVWYVMEESAHMSWDSSVSAEA